MKNKTIVNWISVPIILLSVIPLFFNNFQICGEIFNAPPPVVSKNPNFFQVVDRDLYKKQYFNLLLNIGTLNWYGGIIIDVYTEPKYYIEENGQINLNKKYKGELYFTKNVNSASFDRFSPNVLKIKVRLTEPDMLVINQNFHSDWRVDKGKTTNYHGLLAVQLDTQGEYVVKFYYVPVAFYIGLIISLITLGGLLYFLYNLGKSSCFPPLIKGD